MRLAGADFAGRAGSRILRAEFGTLGEQDSGLEILDFS